MACESSLCNSISLAQKWADRLLSSDYNQSHLMAVFLSSFSPPLEYRTYAVSSDDLLHLYQSTFFQAFARALDEVDAAMGEGGLLHYLNRARLLLKQARDGENPMAGWKVHAPQGQVLKADTDLFMHMENIGMSVCHKTAFVLVAGGLGERLGYDQIKISIPVELTTGLSFMHYYAEYIKAFESYPTHLFTDLTTNGISPSHGGEEKSRGGDDGTEGRRSHIPLVVMTSADTHDKTLDFFSKNKNFGLKDVSFIKQDKVPALADAEARIAIKRVEREKVNENESYNLGCQWEIEMKPHGHGDVHTLLYQHGYFDQWTSEGREWVVFFQDTNALVFRGIPAALGVSVRNQFALNSIAVPRKPGEAVGGICKLTKPDGSSVTLNVEYNLLDPLLRNGGGGGDEPDPETGNSRFPGNTNALIVRLDDYKRILTETKGVVPEFVNPKYKDASRMSFKSSARLECMMQDLPRQFPPSMKVGFTELERWLCYSAVKNSIADAAAMTRQGRPGECALTSETDVYLNNVRQLQMACKYLLHNKSVTGGLKHLPQVGVTAPEDNAVEFQGVRSFMPTRVVLLPSWGVTRQQIAYRIEPCSKLYMTDNVGM